MLKNEEEKEVGLIYVSIICSKGVKIKDNFDEETEKLLKIQVKKAELLKVGKKVAPYCVVEIAEQRQKTKVHSASRSPKWKEVMNFNGALAQLIKVQVMDNNKKNLIGSTQVFLTEFLGKEGDPLKSHIVKISKNGQEVGSITLQGIAI